MAARPFRLDAGETNRRQFFDLFKQEHKAFGIVRIHACKAIASVPSTGGGRALCRLLQWATGASLLRQTRTALHAFSILHG